MKKYANKVKDLQKKIDAVNAVFNSKPYQIEDILDVPDEEKPDVWDMAQLIWLKMHRDDYETLKELNGMEIETTVFLDRGKKDHVKLNGYFCFGGRLLNVGDDFYVGVDKYVLRDLTTIFTALEYLNFDFDNQPTIENKVMLDYDAMGL